MGFFHTIFLSEDGFSAFIYSGANAQSLETAYVSRDFSFSAKNQDRLRPLPFLKEAGGLLFMKIRMRSAGETLSMKEAFETFTVVQTAKGVSDKTLSTYHSHFRTQAYPSCLLLEAG